MNLRSGCIWKYQFNGQFWIFLGLIWKLFEYSRLPG